ncbi:DUF6932 family protein [Limnofasciculus baicalensis]|uniref:Uncharacterized protein n=1 Tax=Limnofasciculus baicalensis BBK-W-15 TaxID=2699891 RepID=A0AAE3GXL6_9CYAN|nr:hypothetical protein [Limnofasciculus baicalensis]MCP2732460.1 hypothetical protein [Limnofasciculus baicalensis BBK-W-15]
MIPPFDENGNLPPGIYWTEWSEFKERYGTTWKRLQMIQGLETAMAQLKVAGCRSIYINGSFVTSEANPKDFDACWDSEDVDFTLLQRIAPTLLNYDDKRAAQKIKYKGEIFRSDQIADNYGTMSIDFFQRDRSKNTKGIIAIDLLRWEP